MNITKTLKLTKAPSFIEGIVIAVIASIVGSIGYFVLSAIFPFSIVIKLLASGFSFAYILYLLSRSQERIGRISSVVVWSIITIGLWLSGAVFSIFILSQILMIWLLRSLYFYSSLLSSGADLFLSGFSLAAGIWAFFNTGSAFLSIWTLFLVQALFVFIPSRMGAKGNKTNSTTLDNNHFDLKTVNFQRAYRNAEAAVRKLSSQ